MISQLIGTFVWPVELPHPKPSLENPAMTSSAVLYFYLEREKLADGNFAVRPYCRLVHPAFSESFRRVLDCDVVELSPVMMVLAMGIQGFQQNMKRARNGHFPYLDFSAIFARFEATPQYQPGRQWFTVLKTLLIKLPTLEGQFAWPNTAGLIVV